MELANISDTARWVAMYRVMESERKDALFHDPFARRLAGARGEEILAAMPRGRSFAWPMIVRTSLFDEIILRLAGQIDTVLNLAAGLDARPYRLDLPPSLKWIDVDLPPMIDYKRGMLADQKPRCEMEYVALDLADRAPLRFGPEEGPQFYAQFGWRAAEARATWDEAKRLKRLPGQMRLWSLLSFITPKKVREQQQKGLSGVVLMERA
jgi:hypothetical protein